MRHAFRVADLEVVRRMSTLSPLSTSWNMFQRTLIYLAASSLSLLASRWLYVFVFTSYRTHHRPIVIPLALLTLVFAFTLFRLSAASVVLLIVLACIVGFAALYIQISGAFIHTFLIAAIVSAIIYVTALVTRFTKCA